MSCDKYLDLISARLDGQLTVQEESDLTAHLQTCPACRAIAKDMEDLHSALACVGEVDAPAALSQSVLSKIRSEKRPARRHTLRQLSALAACLVLCVTAWYVSLPDLNSAPQVLSDAWNTASAGQTVPSAARYVAEDPKFKSLPFSIDVYSLSQTDLSTTPSAHLLASADGLARFLAQFPADDLSLVKNTYDEAFFLTNRLLAVVVQETSSSITHTICELTQDSVTILRDTSAPGDNDQPRWLMLIPTQLTGPERALSVEFVNQ